MSWAFMLKSSLNDAARNAARNLSIDYGQNPSIAGNRSMEDTLVFDSIRINNIINSSSQFSDPTFDTASSPPVVTVTVKYKGGTYGLPPFPNPDPLGLGKNFQVSATASYSLE